MTDTLLAVAIGLGAGVLSGAFGIGGGVVMVPALTLVLGFDGLTAVGTSLPVIFPSAATGAFAYLRAGLADWRSGLRLGLGGLPTAVAGAWLAERVGGSIVLAVLVAVVLYTAADMALQVLRPRARANAADAQRESLSWPLGLGIGAITGLYSGFLGLGGGFIMVPMMTRFGHVAAKRAIGTSLVAILLLAIPGTISHAALGNTVWPIAAALTLGVVPGSLIGSRITLGASERAVRIAFAVLLVVVGSLVVAQEMGWL